MTRVVGINLTGERRIEWALTAIYGIGLATAQKIVAACGIKNSPKVKDVPEAQIEKVRLYIDKNVRVEGDARMVVTHNIKRLRDIGAYRGVRHAVHLPVHGQRTKTNARTRKGPRVTMGSGRKKQADKT